MRNIMVQSTEGDANKSLYKVLAHLKKDHNCTFDFCVNVYGEISVAAITPSDYIMDAFVITNRQNLFAERLGSSDFLTSKDKLQVDDV